MTEVILETLKNYGICSANSHIREGLCMLAERGKDRRLPSGTWARTPHHVTLDYPPNQGLLAAPAVNGCGLDDLPAASLGHHSCDRTTVHAGLGHDDFFLQSARNCLWQISLIQLIF